MAIYLVRAFAVSSVTTGSGMAKRVEFLMEELLSPPYLYSVLTCSKMRLIAVMNLSACLLSLQSKMYPSSDVEFPLNLFTGGRVLRFWRLLVLERFE